MFELPAWNTRNSIGRDEYSKKQDHWPIRSRFTQTHGLKNHCLCIAMAPNIGGSRAMNPFALWLKTVVQKNSPNWVTHGPVPFYKWKWWRSLDFQVAKLSHEQPANLWGGLVSSWFSTLGRCHFGGSMLDPDAPSMVYIYLHGPIPGAPPSLSAVLIGACRHLHATPNWPAGLQTKNGCWFTSKTFGGFLKWGHTQIIHCHKIFHAEPSITTISGNFNILKPRK